MLALAVLFVVSLPAVTTRIYASDEAQYFAYLRSLYFDQDVSFENEYRYFYEHDIAQSPGFHQTFLEEQTARGRRVNYGTVGAPLLWLPFYAVADLWTRATGAADANGFTSPYVSAVAYGSAFYAFIGVLLSIRAARLIVGEHSLFAGLAVWIGTPLLFYMYVAPPFAHACSAFAVALFVNVWLHVRQRWSPRGAFVLGVCAALMAMVREQDVFLAVGPAADFAWNWLSASRNARGTSPARATRLGDYLVAALAGVAGAVVAYTPQLLAYNALNGYPGPAAHVSRKMYWYSPHALQVLASPSHGWLFWTPLALLAIGGLVVLASGGLKLAPTGSGRLIGLSLLLMVFSQLYVAGSVASWTVAGAFGQRRFVCLTIVLTIGLAALFSAAGRRTRQVLAALTVVMVWWNIALMAQFATRLMDRQRLEPARNAYHAFVTLPIRLPALAYRYLTNRESFYEPPATHEP